MHKDAFALLAYTKSKNESARFGFNCACMVCVQAKIPHNKNSLKRIVIKIKKLNLQLT